MMCGIITEITFLQALISRHITFLFVPTYLARVIKRSQSRQCTSRKVTILELEQ
jgi:hypothetical protein